MDTARTTYRWLLRPVVVLLLLALAGCYKHTSLSPFPAPGTPDWLDNALAVDADAPRGVSPGQPNRSAQRNPNVAAGTPAGGLPQPLILPKGGDPKSNPNRARAGSANRPGLRGANNAPVKLPSDASPVERLYHEQSEAPPQTLAQFGYDFFTKRDKDSGSALVDADYVLGPGDEVRIRVWNNPDIEGEHQLKLDRDGNVSIPRVGVVTLANLRASQVERVIREAYSVRYTNFQLQVSLGELKTIAVYVLGEVKAAGLHHLSGYATVSTALLSAGGPRKSGSLRRIEIRRPDGTRRIVDLYDFLLTGDQLHDVVLRPGDSIFVPVIGETVGVGGAVRRPGIYELVGQATGDTAIKLAGGMHSFTHRAFVQIERTVNGQRRVSDVRVDQLPQARLAGGERISVFAVDPQARNIVEIAGSVERPGRYELAAGMRISDLIQLAGPVHHDAYLDRVPLSRQLGRPDQYELVKDRTSASTRRQVVYVDLNKVLQGDRRANLQLMPLDHLYIPSLIEARPDPIVEVGGAVRFPGKFELTSRMTLVDALRRAGGVLTDAYLGEGEIARRRYDDNGQVTDVDRIRVDIGKALREDPRHNIELHNLDRITIRRLGKSAVTVSVTGHVKFPGKYTLPAGSQVVDLFVQAGGLTGRGDMRAAVFTRRSVREVQQARFDDMAARYGQDLMKAYEMLTRDGHRPESQAGKLAMQHGQKLYKEFKRLQATGRVVLDFGRDDFPGSPHNLVLEDGDALHVPIRSTVVMVLGEVFNPSAVIHEPGRTVEEYIDQVGGITPYADDRAIYVIRSDGTVQSMKRHDLDPKAIMLAKLQPGDSVLVPGETMQRSPTRVAFDTVHYIQEWASVILLLSKSASLVRSTIDGGLANAGADTDTTRLDRLLNVTSDAFRQQAFDPLPDTNGIPVAPDSP